MRRDVNVIAVIPPNSLSDWAELGIVPPADEVEEAKLIDKMLKGDLQLIVVIPDDGSPTYVTLSSSTTPPSITSDSQSKGKSLPVSQSSICIEVIKRALVDMTTPEFALTPNDFDRLRDFLLSNVQTIKKELHSADEAASRTAAKLIYICCTPLDIPNVGKTTLFNPNGANPFAEMKPNALRVLRQ